MKVNKLLNDNLSIDIDKSIKNTYLILRNIKINQSSYEFKILQEENIDSILRPELFYEGSEQVLKYNISDKVSLNDYLINNKLKKRDLKYIIKTIDNMLSSIENYLLSENSILLDTRTIMIGKEDKKNKIKFIVIPNYNSDFSYELSKLLIRLLRHIDVNDKEALNLAYALFVKSSKDNFTINDLLELCEEDKDSFDEETIENTNELIYYSDIENETKDEIDYNIIDSICAKQSNEVETNTNANPNNDSGINVDDEVTKMLNDDIFDDFDDKKEIKQKPINKKSSKNVKGLVNAVLPLLKMAVPIFILIGPIFLYFKLGKAGFLNNIKLVVAYEVVVMMILLINIIFDTSFGKSLK